MPPAVHLRPDRLRVHAAEASRLSESVQAALAGQPDHPDVDHVGTSLRRAARELSELAAVLLAAAEGAERADADAARALNRAGERP